MINAVALRNGIVLKVDNELYTVVWFQHTQPGKGPAYMKVKLKSLKKNTVTEKIFRTQEKVENVSVERKVMQFLYKADNEFIFMDKETFDQVHVQKEMLGEDELLLKEGFDIEILFYENKPMLIEFPTFVELKVIMTEPGLKGDTVNNTLKPAELETGLKIGVPLFVNEGDMIKVDTRDKSYKERVK